MKNVLVTGAAGFIGSHLTELLCEKGYNVTAFVRYNSSNSWGRLESSKFKNDIKVISGDIRDFDSVFKATENIDIIFHLAALIGIPYSYNSPKAYIETNITGTYNILESAKLRGTEQVLITSTSETYGSAQYVPIDEAHPLVGQSPYSATKISADEISLSFYRSFEMPVKIVRPFNTYGPRQSARAFIPTVISQMIAGNKELSLGNLDPTRDFTFVKDTANGFLEIYKNFENFGEVVNIGNNKEISMEDLLVLLSNKLKFPFEIKIDKKRIRPEKSEVERLCCDNSKILSNTNWKPNYSLDQGLDLTINWIRNNINNFKHNIYNV